MAPKVNPPKASKGKSPVFTAQTLSEINSKRARILSRDYKVQHYATMNLRNTGTDVLVPAIREAMSSGSLK